MRYLPHTAEEYAQIKGNTTKGHTDFGLLTILFPQAVAGLQVCETERDGVENELERG